MIEMFGQRTSCIVMIGMPIQDSAHDRFVAGAGGPCLSLRGLLAWGADNVQEQIDAGDTSKNGREHP
jgi:hypothetical protein